MEGIWATVMLKLMRMNENLSGGDYSDTLELIKLTSGITVMRQTTATVGMRVGRPEKAMLRHLKPPVHVLFPVGSAGGMTRDIIGASKKGMISD